MIKKVARGVGRAVKPFVNVPRWMGWQNLKADQQRVGALAKSLMQSNKKPVIRETFEEAVARLNLTEEAISTRKRDLLRAALFYVFLAAVIFVYALYLLFILKLVLGAAVAFMLVAVTLTLAFKQHFWYIQMKYRRLGFTFNEWVNATFTKGGSADDSPQ